MRRISDGGLLYSHDDDDEKTDFVPGEAMVVAKRERVELESCLFGQQEPRE